MVFHAGLALCRHRTCIHSGGMSGSVPGRVLLLLVGMGLLPAVVAAQGLGGVARSEAQRREQRTPARAETQTYTNSDLRVEEEPDANDSSADGPEPATGSSAPSTRDGRRPETAFVVDRPDLERLRAQLDRASARRKEREQKWRTRVAALRSKVAAARKEHDVACNPSSISLRGG